MPVSSNLYGEFFIANWQGCFCLENFEMIQYCNRKKNRLCCLWKSASHENVILSPYKFRTLCLRAKFRIYFQYIIDSIPGPVNRFDQCSYEHLSGNVFGIPIWVQHSVLKKKQEMNGSHDGVNCMIILMQNDLADHVFLKFAFFKPVPYPSLFWRCEQNKRLKFAKITYTKPRAAGRKML